MSLFRSVFRRKPKSESTPVPAGIPREKFILLLNLGYDGFRSKDKIADYVSEGDYPIQYRLYCIHPCTSFFVKHFKKAGMYSIKN